MPATTNDSEIAGPALVAAAMPVSTKMPVPTITPMPKTVRSQADRSFLSWCSGSSVSWIDCSIDLVRNRSMHGDCPTADDRNPTGAVPAHPIW
jgi:hypothetical protein